MKKLLTSMLAAMMAFAMVGCSSAAPAPSAAPEATPEPTEAPSETEAPEEESEEASFTVTPGVLTVSMSTDFAPMEFVDLTKEGQDMYVGSDVELAKFIAKELGLDLEIKSMSFDASQVAVSSGIVDCSISGYSYTTERAAAYLLSEDYFEEGDSGQVVVIAKENAELYPDLASLNSADIKVAAQNGALQQELVQEQLPECTMVAIDDLNSTYDTLTSGAIQGVAVAKSVAETLVESAPDKYAIVAEQFDDSKYTGYHILIALGNNELLEAINKAIAKVPEGEYAKWQDEANSLFLSLGDNAAEDIIAEEE